MYLVEYLAHQNELTIIFLNLNTIMHGHHHICL